MDISLLSSTSSSNVSSASNNKHITIARKLHDISRRIQYAKRIIKEEGVLEYGGCTNERVGPPTFLGEPHKTEWRKDIRACANKCVWHYLLPSYLQKTEYYKKKVQVDIVDKITEDNKEIIERGIKLGRDRANKKWDKREGIIKTDKDINNNIGSFREEEIGLLKRGEPKLLEGEVLEVSNNINQTSDVFKIISHTIYGSGRFRRLVIRNMWKFIQLYESIEKAKFKPFIGKLSNNTEKWIHTWSMFCGFLKNRDLPITAFELGIISKLYDVKIKIFRKTQTGYSCMWCSEYNSSREVNLLNTYNNEWSALVKVKCSKKPTMFSYLKDVEQLERNNNNEERLNNKSLNITQVNQELRNETSRVFEEAIRDKELEISHKEGSTRRNFSIESMNSSGFSRESHEEKKGVDVRNRRKILLWQKWRKKVRDSKRNRERKREEILKREGSKVKRRQLVFDFTKEGLSSDEIEFLSKGESFCVVNHKVDEDRLRTDIFNYGRRLRLHEEFREPKVVSQNTDNRFSVITQTQIETNRSNVARTSNSLTPITQTPVDRSSTTNIAQQTVSQYSTLRDRFFSEKEKIRKPASLYDPDSQNRNLNRYIQCIQEESMLIIKKKIEFRDNITVEQRQAMNSLIDKIEKKDIIITKADKGSGLVAVDYELYIQKGTKYIEEEAKAYIKVNDSAKNLIHKLTKARNSVVHKLKTNEVIEIETATYCNKQLEEKITGLKFYYKIHKDSNIHTMPLRPLQSCINAPTHHLSQVLTDILQPFLKDKYIPTYLQDSNQLLYRLDKLQALRLEDTIISSDVAALYPSIPHEEGMLAVTEFLQHNSTYSEDQITSIVKALELVIMENYVVWNSQIYKQSSGVAMGTPVAVAYANIFMNWIDEEVKQRAPFIIQHYRYIDDNLFILPKDKIEDLMHITNNILRPQIRFTYETLDRQTEIGLSFLDTLLFITEEGKIESRLYTKKTDKHAYLLPSSYHPLHITKNIPQAVFNRIRRLCSRDEWYQVDASQAIEWLEDRGYNYKDIKKAAENSMKKDRNVLINNIEEKRNKVIDSHTIEDIFNIPFLVTYSHPTQRIKEVLKQRKGLLDASFTATKVRPRLTFRRQKNISDIIVQKGLRGPITNNAERVLSMCGEKPKYRTVCPCKGRHDQKICRCCAHIKLKIEGVKVKLHKQVDCDTKNIIYMIGCNLCSKKYIGETQQKLKERLVQHLSNISKLTQPLYTHFNQIHKAENLYITVVETVKCGEAAFRKVREAWWINRLQTLEPRGFNVKLECHQIYQANRHTLQIERENSHNKRRPF